MTQDQMYEHVRAQMRQGATALDALSKTLAAAGSEIKPFLKGDQHLYVRCDGMPSHSITTIDFLCSANFLTWRIVAFCRVVDGVNDGICPECGAPGKMTWSGLDLVENTGDETLASKHIRHQSIATPYIKIYRS